MSRKKRKRPPGEKRLLTVLGQAGRPLLLKEIQELLDIPADKAQWVKEGLDRLVERGDLVLIKGKRYGLTDKMNLMAGALSVHPDGFGFVTPETGGKDIFMVAADLKDAWHGDRVVVRIEGSRGRRREGRVIRILSRAVPTCWASCARPATPITWSPRTSTCSSTWSSPRST
jgi:ribonuclease R